MQDVFQRENCDGCDIDTLRKKGNFCDLHGFFLSRNIQIAKKYIDIIQKEMFVQYQRAKEKFSLYKVTTQNGYLMRKVINANVS